jgi:hypothetical protein
MALIASDILQALNDAGITKAELTKMFRVLKRDMLLKRQIVLMDKLHASGALTDAERAEMEANETVMANLTALDQG